MAKVWIVYTLMFGYPLPTYDTHEFTNQTGCELYLLTIDETVRTAFQLTCDQK